MGSNPSNLNETSSTRLGKMAGSISYRDIILVKTKPWDTQKRNEEFPFEEITDGMTIESSIIGVNITQPSLTEKECNESDVFPMPYVMLDNNEEREFHTLKNSNGHINLSVEPRIPNRNAIFTFHVKRRGETKWNQYQVRKKKGDMAVSVEIEPLGIDTVFLTSQLEILTVEVTRAGCVKNLDPDNENMKIEFQPGSVRDTIEVTVQVTSLDDVVKGQKLEERLGKDHDIIGMSDLVNVTHDGEFLLPVHLTLPIQPLIPVDGPSTPIVLYIEDNNNENNEIKELEQATVEEIADNHFIISTHHFCQVVCVRRRRNASRRYVENALRYVYDFDDPRCNILLFSKKDDQYLLLRSEIVSEDKRVRKEQERMDGMGMRLIPTCTSPTIRLKNMDRVRISLANHTAIKFPTGIPLRGQFIMYDRNNQDNSLSFYVEMNKALGVPSMATLEYDLDCGPNRRPLHKATFNALKEMRNRQNLSRLSSVDTLNTDASLPRVYYQWQISDSTGLISKRDNNSPYSSGIDVNLSDVMPSLPTGNVPPSRHTLFRDQPNTSKSKVRSSVEEKAVSKKEPRPVSTGDTDTSCSEVFSERSFTLLARQIPDNEFHALASLLNVPIVDADRMEKSLPNSRDRNQLKVRLLIRWLQNESTNPAKRLQTLTQALIDIDQKRLAELVEEAFRRNKPFGLDSV